MWDILRTRLRQGMRTIAYPDAEPFLPERFRGAPLLDASRCPDGCRACIDACPTQALSTAGAELRLDLGRCLFCTDCVEACPEGAIGFGTDPRLAARRREDLVSDGRTRKLAEALEARSRRLFGRSLKLRQVSAGGCNGCESDVNVLGTVVFDLGRFGIQFVASPRHADGLLITGAISHNMRVAVEKTWAAVPEPKLVIAVGACAISGGPYAGHPEVLNGAGALLPVDLYVPGCPPHPITILDGLLRLLGRIEDAREQRGVRAPNP
jgi:Ni,Fe-hydrogenase III small subunit/NAD-dependent dihydropyrimidine dehydrogenase PreA subunit